MKKLVFVLGIVFVTMSSFTSVNIPKDDGYCDDLALFWYYTILNNGGGQAAATQAYQTHLENCYLLGGDTDLEVNLE